MEINFCLKNIKSNTFTIIKVFIVILLLTITNIAHSNSFIVKNIYCHGLKRVPLEKVLLNITMKINDVINNENIANSISKLFSTGYFEEIEILGDAQGIVTIRVQERPIINNVSFCGNTTIKDSIIQEKLEIKNIQSGTPYNDYYIFNAKRFLEELFHDFGKFNVIVKIVTIPLPRDLINIRVMFTEGNTAKIKQIKIIGNKIYHTKKLLSQFILSEKNKWWSISSTRRYQKQKLLRDLEILNNFYLNRGYAKFCIDSTQINLTSDKENVYLFLYIHEGIQYSVTSIIMNDDILLLIPNIKNCIQISTNELYSYNKIKKIEHDIRYILSMHGYMQPVVTIEPDFNDHEKTVKFYIHIDPGHCLHVREVHIEGNTYTKDEVIRREISQMEQKKLDYTLILKDQERLKRYSYLKDINVHLGYLSNTLDQVDLIYQVTEHNTGNLNVSIGMGTESGINTQFSMNQNNVLGTGNSISITGAKNYYQNYAEISAIKNYIGVTPIIINGKLFYNNINARHMHISDYNLKNYGISIDYSYPVIRYHIYNIGLSYTSTNLSKIEPQIAIWRYLQSTNINTHFLFNKMLLSKNINFCANDFLLNSGWSINTLNNYYFPTFGTKMNLLGILTLPVSDNKYYKITVNGANYISLDKYSCWTLMNSVYIGYSGRINKKEPPFYDNFYAGGISTIRGFQLNSIGPKAGYYCCNQDDQNYNTCSIRASQDTIGGNAIIIYKTELITPISYFNEKLSEVTRISLFLDAGTVWDSFWKNTEMTYAANIPDYSIVTNIRISGGISLKWVSPVGPIIFSYSKVLKKYLGDVEEPFQFSIGRNW